jgi:hypothetical protein
MVTRACKRKLEAALLEEDDAANANHPAEDSYAVHLDVDAYLANFVAAPEVQLVPGSTTRPQSKT